METNFVSFREAIEARRKAVPEPKIKSQRAELFKELYGFYERSYKLNAWKDYTNWLRSNRFKDSKARQEEFRKSKAFRKIIPVKSFCSYWFSFLKTNDLFYLISVARDMERRGGNFNKWLFWAIKDNK